jgi:hypothetical protein
VDSFLIPTAVDVNVEDEASSWEEVDVQDGEDFKNEIIQDPAPVD